MVILHGVNYTHSNGDPLFSGLDLIINKNDKIALVGHNGSGKSTLLKIINHELQPIEGIVKCVDKPYYVPQHFGQFNSLSVAEALGIDLKLKALQTILEGAATEDDFVVLNDDWTIETRCAEALQYWQLQEVALDQKMGTLSGGQKTKVFLAGISLHNPALVLMDEPSNHLDRSGRDLLYNYISTTRHTLLVVSHDRSLLNLLHTTYELSSMRGITVYGCSYDDYVVQKALENEVVMQEIRNKEKTLRKAKEQEKMAAERRQRLDARGKKKQEKAGLPTISMNTLKNNAEKSTARLKEVHAEKVGAISIELTELRSGFSENDQMKINLDHTSIYPGKPLITVSDVNFSYQTKPLWKEPLNFKVLSGSRLAVEGLNGSGKSTLIRLLLDQLKPERGTIIRSAAIRYLYIDQDYSLINNGWTVYQQAQQANTVGLQEHEIKIRLSRFLFDKNDWDKSCKDLSGGEKMRLMLCTLTIAEQAPDLIVLDEPTNNLDIQNIEILINAMNVYRGSLLVVCHDTGFLKQLQIDNFIYLS